MINTMQRAIIKKDLRGITANKQVFATIFIVPLALVIIMPAIFLIVIAFTPEDSPSIQPLLEMLPQYGATGDFRDEIINIFLNSIMPIFFLLIPIMASSVMAASSFVGEKEKRTLETLLYSPLSLGQIFQSKILASFLMSMMVSFASFVAMLIVIETIVVVTAGGFVLPSIGWLITMLLISPALSFLAITLIVSGSAKAQTVEEAQQRVMFLILPIILIFIGQFTGLLLVSAWIMLAFGILLAFLAVFTMRRTIGKFSYEVLLR